MRTKYVWVAPILFFAGSVFCQKPVEVKSPNGKLKVVIEYQDTLRFSLLAESTLALPSSPIALQLGTGSWLGVKSKLIKNTARSVRDSIINPVPHKRNVIPDRYNEAALYFKEKFSVLFRAYDDGIAYRFQTKLADSTIIKDELASYKFNEDPIIYFPEVKKRDDADIFHTSFEEPYSILKLSELKSGQVGFSPMLLNLGHSKIFITESDLLDYPGMFLTSRQPNELRGLFAPYPGKEVTQGGEFKQKVVVQRKDFIAKTKGTRSFPWRVIGYAQRDEELLMNDLVYRLGSKPKNGDWSWVKPGMSTEEWICGINLYNVPFKAGLNTATYKYYIDFAERFHLNYVMLDAGWSDNDDLFKITPGMDLEEIARYAKQKGVSLILWTLAMTLDRQLELALTEFNRLGVKAIMTDFMDRDDQKMMQFYERIATACADHKIMVMFHGAFKNAGFDRTFPNSITREGVMGSEYNIWSSKASPEHDLLIPFIRMTSGPMDYEPGFFENASKELHRPTPERVTSQGTRCHQLAMFVVYESPLQMFSGNPSDAWREPEYMEFLGAIPTVWDETKVIEAKLGDHVLIARRKGRNWFVAGMTDWEPKEFDVDLNFLGNGKYQSTFYEDGLNAKKNPRDYQRKEMAVEKNQKLKIRMAEGGGFVWRFVKM
jgi:alpha-glucosidase